MSDIPSEKIEILAPVGGKEQLIAAVRSGADAVYLGTRGFNARRNAENFDAHSDLREAVGYCHARGVRVHVTLNTLVCDDELGSLETEIENVAASGADAVIVQDLAVASMLRRCCPDIEMHASTQMAIHNVEGVKALEKLGFSRVVLARELSLEEIKSIIRSTSMEAEVFVHGALCVSVSGLCGLSAMIGGRSGNRGMCAQPCRLDFRCGDCHYALSLKDMSSITALPELAKAGVRSVKIEGRMKRPEYVAAAVNACRAALAGEPVDMETLQAVFSRSGFTDGYLRGRRTKDMFGYRTKEDVAAGQGVFKKLAGLYNREYQSLPVDMALNVESCRPVSLTVSGAGQSVTVTGPEPEISRTVDMSADAAEKNLSRTGGTQFYLHSFSASMAPGLTLPLAELNRMRRDALSALDKRLSDIPPKPFSPSALPELKAHISAESPQLRLRFENAEQLFPDDRAGLIILPLREISRTPGLIDEYGPRLAAELPTLCYPQREDILRGELERLSKLGLASVVAENLGVLSLASGLGFEVHGGAGLNVLNSRSIESYKQLGASDLTVSFELSMSRLRSLGGSTPRGIIAYGYLPLMRFRACPGFHRGGCSVCSGKLELKDRRNESFTVLCREKQYSELHNCVPLYIGDKQIRGADFCTLYFTTETRQRCREITDMFVRGDQAQFRHTGGLYFRELL